MKFFSIVISLVIVISFSSPVFAERMCEVEQVKPEKADPRCAHRGEIGMCRAIIESWHYDPAGNSCKSFFWGGCGDPKPFSSEKECLEACAGKTK